MRDRASTRASLSSDYLPRNASPFVGRAFELQDLRQALVSTRLLTLTGIGGSGKSRLAIQLVDGVLADYADGVWLIEITPLADPSLIAVTVAAVLGLPERVGSDQSDGLVEALGSRQMLLLFDGCQRIASACGQLAAILLAGCSNLRIVATSRAPLAAPGETVWAVPFMQVSDPRQEASASEEFAARVAESDAGRLFVIAAQRASAGFEVTAANAATITKICGELRGLPLAIELTTARLRSMSLDQVRVGVESFARRATEDRPNAAPAEEMLSDVIGWTHDLLSPENQQFFRRLAVFAAGWRLDAAASVGFTGVNEGRSVDVVDVLAGLSALTENSLVVANDSGGAVPRYWFPETIREYASERLDAAGETDGRRARHAAYYQALAERCTVKMWVAMDYRDSDFVDEIANIRGALWWCLSRDNWEGCLGLIGSLAVYWFGGGHSVESAGWIDLALRHQGDVEPSTRGRALIGLGLLIFGRGEYTRAEDLLRVGVVTCRAHGNFPETVRGLLALGITFRDVGRLGEAMQALDDALEVSRSIGDRGLICGALLQEGLLARQEGDLTRARGILTEALRLVRDEGNLPGVECQITYNLGLVDEDQGDRQEARYWYIQSLPLIQAAGFRWLLPFVVEAFVTLAARESEPEKAMVLAGAASAARELMGNPIPPVMKVRLDHAISRARLYLGDRSEAAWNLGARMTVDQAVAYATETESATQSDERPR